MQSSDAVNVEDVPAYALRFGWQEVESKKGEAFCGISGWRGWCRVERIIAVGSSSGNVRDLKVEARCGIGALAGRYCDG